MAAPSAADRLLARVAHRRAGANALLQSARAASLLGLAYACLIVVARTWWPLAAADVESPWLLASLAAAALAYGVLRGSRGDRAQAARAIDAHAHTDDLFLARSTLGASGLAPALAPFLEGEAQTRAAAIDPAAVAPWRLGRVARRWGAGAVLAAAAFWLVPTSAARAPAPPPRADLAAKAASRIEALRKREVQAPTSPAVDAALAELQRTLAKLQAARTPETRAELRRVEHKLAELWQKAKASAADPRGLGPNSLGQGDREKQAEWKRELAAGSVEALRRELQSATAAASGDPAAAASARAAARELRAFAQAHGAAGLSEAMADLLQKLGEGEAGARELAALTERAALELDALQQAASDLAALEGALRAEQLAGALDQLDADLPPFDPAAALAAYEKAMGERLIDELEDLEACEDCEGGG